MLRGLHIKGVQVQRTVTTAVAKKPFPHDTQVQL